MSLKAIAFTDGTKLALYSSGAPWDDSITYYNTVEVFLLENAFITAGDPSGGYVNPNLSGKRFTDMDGNVWAFTLNGSTMTATILKTDGTTVNKTLSRSYSATWDTWIWYVCCRGVTAGGLYEICWGGKRPTTSSSRQTTGTGRYLRMGYVNGISGQYNISDDAALLDPETYNAVSSSLRNLTPGSPFVNATGYKLGTAGGTTHEACDYYSNPYSSGNEDSNPFLLLSENAITDYSPPIPVEDTDPFSPGGNTGDDGTGGTGGTGDFDGTSDNIDFPTAPAVSAVDTKFISLYTPTLTELNALASYMWSSAFDLTTLKKLFANPMDCILGLSIVPVAVPSGGSRAVTVGDIATGVNMTVAGAQYIEVDCGTLNVNEFWGAYLDYDPYTKAELYLPFIGIHPLAVDDIMGKAVHIKYRVDILSGACVAFVKCGDSVLYTFIGQCSSSIPITGNDWTNVINGVLTVAGSIGTMVATGGATAPMGAAAIASTAVNSFKPSVEKSGAMSGTGGMMGIKTPYMILTRPRQALPANQNEFTGYPSFITRTLDSLEGYTEIDSCHLENIPATGEEITELENILKSGVIF